MTKDKLRPVGIVGTGSWTPSKVVTNFDLEKIIDTSDEWIRQRTGIVERRIAEDDEASSDLATRAALIALKDANVLPTKVEMIIVATVTPDMTFPTTACMVQKNIGAEHAACFDLLAACSGFSYALEVGRQLIAAHTYKTVLVISADTLSKITDWTDRNTCVLFGDGAGAAVLQPVEKGRGILSSYLGADGSQSDILQLPGGGSRNPVSQKLIDERGHYIKMRGQEVFKIAVPTMCKAAKKALHLAGLALSDVDLFIPHQANLRIIEAVAKRLHLPMEKIFINLHKYGNSSSASTAIAIDEANKEGRMKKGDVVVLSSFGGGLCWGGTVIRW
ncbi:MAG: beta-ketoacyl-ACP synthase III [bacterium]|nr:beta-ketoacyl-ACP synthase III [bacterium]